MLNSQVLLIAGECEARCELEDRLRQAGCEVLTAGDGELGIRRAIHQSPDVVLVGNHLPDWDSLDVCRHIRSELAAVDVPVILLIPDIQPPGSNSIPGEAAKPLDLLQFARAVKTLSGSTRSDVELRIEYDGLLIDRLSYRAFVDGGELKLTLTEFNLLWALAQQPGKVLSRRELTENCRGENADARERTIDAHVKSMRRKLGGRSDLIQTVRGVGYRLRHSQTLAAV